MKSIEKLRKVAEEQSSPVMCKLVRVYTDQDVMSASNHGVREALGVAIDEIEEELEERYVELPVDSNGVPINYGDRLTDGEYTFTVARMEYYGYGSWSVLNVDGNAWACCDVEHVPDPYKQLRPCPFCGSNDLYIVEHVIGRDAPFMCTDDKTVGIFCNTCKQTVTLEANEDEGRSLNTEQRAVEAWNRRERGE